MHATRIRTLGFLIPTTLIVTGQHLAQESTAGEALDGVVASLFFTTLFLLGTLTASAMRGRASGGARHPRARELARGVLAGLAAWALLWAFWAVPPTQGLREATDVVFPLNCLWMMMAGAAAHPARSRRTLVRT